MRVVLLMVLAAVPMAAAAGCGRPAAVGPAAATKYYSPVTKRSPATRLRSSADPAEEVDVAAERAKLPAAERALVDAQEWCVVSTDEHLGAMGPPVRLDVKGQPVFVCCGGCRKKALADPDRTLAAAEALKAKKRAAAGGA